MPKAAVHEDNLAAAEKYDVRPTRQILPVQPESVSEPVNQAAEGELRPRVFAPDAPHVGAAPFSADLIHCKLKVALILVVNRRLKSVT
jgi:hypothetical protein